MSQKRSFDEVDTDYQEFDFLTGHQSKRQKLLEHDAKEATIKKIETIIRREFARELCNKETEIDLIDERINEGRRLLDRLRACIVAQHYSKVLPNAGPSSSASALSDSHSTVIHPAVKKFIGKTICSSSRSTHGRPSSSSAFSASHNVDSRSIEERSRSKQTGQSKNTSTDSRVNRSQFGGVGGGSVTSSEQQCSRGDRFKIVKKLIVGNVSKYLAPDKKEANDKSTHKWMVYVRGPKEEPPIDEFVEKVSFFLHDSYFPNNVVDITQPPFHLTRRGWGEFQVRVQLHCRGPSRKIFNISHQLKLDRTYTGLQTMGAETVVEIKLDKEITGRLSRVLHDPFDSPPRQEAEETMDQLPQLPIKEEKDDDGYEDPTATELATKSQDALRESMPSTATTRSDQVQLTVFESSLQHEIRRVDSIRNSDSTVFVSECGTYDTTGLPMNSHVLESAGVERSDTCMGGSVDCDNFHEEVVVCNAVNLEHASFDAESCDNVLEETVMGEGVCIEPDYSSSKLKGFGDLRNGGVEVLVGCDSVREEVVICDAIRVEPTSGNEESEHSRNSQSNDEITDDPCFKTSSFGGASGLVNDVETERAVVCVNRTPTACDDDDVLDVEPVVSVGNRMEPAVNAEPEARTLDVCPTPEVEQAVSTAAVGVPARTKETEDHGFFRCVDSSGRVFRIPRHLVVQSSSVAKTNATIPITHVATAQASKTMTTNRLNNALSGIGTSEQQRVALPQMIATSTPRLPLTSSTGQINTTNNRFVTCGNTTVSRVTLNSTGLDTLANVATKEVVGVVGGGGKLGYVSGATSIVGPGTRGIIRGGSSGDSIVVVSSPGSLSSNSSSKTMAFVAPKTMALVAPKTMALVAPKTMALVAPGAIQEPSFGVRVVTQNQSLKLGSASPSVTMTAVQSDRSKTVMVRSVSMGPGQSQVVLSSMRGGQLVRNSRGGGGGPVTFVAMKRPSGAAPIVRSLAPNVRGLAPIDQGLAPIVRSLPPGVSNCLAATASPVLSSAGPAARLLHSQASPAASSFPPSQVSSVVRAFSSQVIPVMRSLPSQVSPVVVGSLSSQVRPIQRSMQQNCSTSRPKLDSPPVFLLVPSDVKGHHVAVSPNSAQQAVRHVLLVPKGTKISSSGLTSQLKTKAGVQPGKPLSGNQDMTLASGSTGIHLVTDSNGGRARAVSILRPPTPSTSSMTSLLKKNLFVPPPVSVSLPPGEGQHPTTSVSSNNIPPSVKSSAGKSAVVQTRTAGLTRAAETLLKTQIGSQTVIVKLDSSKKCGVAQQLKVDEELKVDDPCLLVPSVTVQENRIPIARPREKHLMFKTLRDSSSQRKPPENVTANISLQDLESMEDIVRSLAKHFPVYGNNVDRSVHPYCASSWNGFLQWNIGKRRAAELGRAVAIQRKTCSLLNGVEMFRGEVIWSKQQIIKWCRRYLYTPLDSELAIHLPESEMEQQQSDAPEAFTSLTNHREALSCLDAMSRLSSTAQDNGNNDDEEDIVLDVITIEESPEKEMKVKRLPVKVMTGAEVIPPSVEAQFVHEAAAKIGIRLSPAPVSPDECPDVLSSTVEEMIAAATRAFANELVRTAAAKLFDSGRDPLQLDVASISEAIRTMNRCDFLTNRSLGVHENDMNPS